MALSGSDLAYKYARSGIARAGASRVNYYRPINLHLKINGTTRTKLVYPESIVIEDTAHQAYNTCRLTVFGFTPAVGQSITIGLGDAATNLIFGGRILTVTTVVGRRSFERKHYELTCVDYTWDLNRRRIVQLMESQSATDVVLQILASYTTGITSVHVQPGLAEVERIPFTYSTVSDAFDTIAAQIGAHWYVDYFADLHFYTDEELDGAPETLSTSSKWEWRDLRHMKDLSQVRTRIYAEGGGAQVVATRNGPTLGTVTDTGAGLISRPPSTDNDSYVYVDAVAYGFGSQDRIRIDQSIYIPDNALAAFDDLTTEPVTVATVTSNTAAGSTSIPVSTVVGIPTLVAGGSGIVQIGHQFIAFSNTSGGNTLIGIPSTGEGSILSDIVSGEEVIVPRYLLLEADSPSSSRVAQTHLAGAQVRSVRIRDAGGTAIAALAAIDGSDGVREGYVEDERDSYFGAAGRGDAEYLAWAFPIESLTYRTRDVNARSGKTVSLSVAGLTGDYFIQKVTISQIEETMNEFPWRMVEASSQRFDLLDLLAQVEGRR